MKIRHLTLALALLPGTLPGLADDPPENARALRHRFVETNGIRMHLAEQGEGPLVVLCHGFPEGWYSWRHQLPALAAAGYRAVAPDQRGYGETDQPEEIEAYEILQLASDIVGLVHALGEDSAVLVGHDWGAQVAWTTALLRPDVFRAVALLSVPFRPTRWDDPPPLDAVRRRSTEEREFYILTFQEPGKAEAEFEADIPETMAKMLYGASASCPPEKRLRAFHRRSAGFLGDVAYPQTLPVWLSQDELDFYVRQFEKTGFRGALNWYRNYERNRRQTAFLNGAKLRQPTLFVAGTEDIVIGLTRPLYDGLERSAPGLTRKMLLPGAGHWVHQELKDEVNEILVGFLREVGP